MTVEAALDKYEKDITPTKKAFTQRAEAGRVKQLKKFFGKYSLAAVTQDLVFKRGWIHLGHRSSSGSKKSRLNGGEQMKILTFCVLAIFLFSARLSFAMDAIAQAAEISNKVNSELEARQFAALNRIEREYRTHQSRLVDGRWKLTFFYRNIGPTGEGAGDAEWKNDLHLADEWIHATPTQPAPYLAKAKMLINYAWEARGGGYADTVSPEGWKLFYQRVAKAEQVLQSAPHVIQKDPYWFVEMEAIALAQGWPEEQFTRLYKAAVSMAPTYEWLYFGAAQYYDPHWYGNSAQLRRFVQAAVQNTKKYEGMTMYARIYWDEINALGDNTFAPGNANWSDMKQGFEDMMAQYPGSRWNLNAFAYYACLARDWPTTRELMKQLRGQPDLRIWDSKERFDGCKTVAQSFVGVK